MERSLAILTFVVISAAILMPAGSEVLAASQAANVEEVVYKTVGDRELRMYINYPPGWKATDKRGVIVFFFGGGWKGGSVGQFKGQAAPCCSCQEQTGSPERAGAMSHRRIIVVWIGFVNRGEKPIIPAGGSAHLGERWRRTHGRTALEDPR